MKEKIKKYKVQLISALVVSVLLIGFFFAMFVLPIMIANSALDHQRAPFLEYGEQDIVELFLPNYRDGDYVTDVSVIFECEEAAQLVARVIELSDGADYVSTDASPAGHWDTSLALRYDSSIVRFYFCRDFFYVADGNTRYIFEVAKEKGEQYASFILELEKIIAKAA